MAALYLATALFFSASPCLALTVEGLPYWLKTHVLRGLSAVWEEIPPGERESRFETLSLVARRLFSGYDVTIEKNRYEPRVVFQAQKVSHWNISLIQPDLREPVELWFKRDIEGMDTELLSLLEGLPMDALSWADSALKDQVEKVLERRLPGWNFSLLVRLEQENGILQLSFHPRQPLVLGVTPSIFSSTLPVMFQSDLSAKLIPGMSPIIGLPVAWIVLHHHDVELWTQTFLEDRNTVSNTRSRVEVAFLPGQVSKVDATVNSERFILQVWLAAYAGIQDRYPEVGILVGWNMNHMTGVNLELYGEMLVDLSEFGISSRFGLRFPVWKNFRVGVEVEWPEQELWFRSLWDSNRIRRPYAWWRYSAEYGHNAALGYRINEHISIEIHYDNRYDDKIGLRGILIL